MLIETIKGHGAMRAVFLHGFPGIRSRQNRELAQEAAQVTGSRTDVLLYSGLGCAPGEFGFRSCIRDVEEYFSDFISHDPGAEFNLVGHSWGGYLSLRVARRFSGQLRKLVLLSPLLAFPDFTVALNGLRAYVQDNPQINIGDIEARAREFVELAQDGSPMDWIRDLAPEVDVLFLQALNDPITTGIFAEEARRCFRRPPRFEIVATDHSFIANRASIKTRVAEFLASDLGKDS